MAIQPAGGPDGAPCLRSVQRVNLSASVAGRIPEIRPRLARKSEGIQPVGERQKDEQEDDNERDRNNDTKPRPRLLKILELPAEFNAVARSQLHLIGDFFPGFGLGSPAVSWFISKCFALAAGK